MVLTRPLTALLFAVLLATPSCIKGVPEAKLAEATPIAALVLVDRADTATVKPASAAVVAAVTDALRDKNLQVVPVAVELDSLSALRTSAQRLSWLSKHSSTDYVLLVEARATFFSRLSGRYRWEVDAISTVAKRSDLATPLTSSTDYPAFLRYDHQGVDDAIAAGASMLAGDVSRLVDRFFATGRAASASTQTAPPVIPASAESTRPSTRPTRPAAPTTRTGLHRFAHPAFSPGEVIYFAMVDRFADGSANAAPVQPASPIGWHGGDLQGVTGNLRHIRGLGATSLWLTPLQATRDEPIGPAGKQHGAFHGYWTTDHRALEPRFGTDADLTTLVAALKKMKMGLWLDFVVNHVGYDAPLTTEQPSWFHGAGDITDWNDAKQLVDHDVHGLPDLDQDNPAVAAYLIDAAKSWVDRTAGALAGFRLDAVKHVPRAFWRRFNDELRAHANARGARFAALGEHFSGDAVELAQVARDGGFDALFDFATHYALLDVVCRGQHPGRLGAMLSLDRLYPERFMPVTLLDNHDLPRVLSICDGSGEMSAAVMLLSGLRGTPSITWGTELGFNGASEPANRAFMDWTLVGKGGLSGAGPELIDTLKARRADPALSTGATRIELLGPHTIVWSRIAETRATLVTYRRGPVGSYAISWPDDIADAATQRPADCQTPRGSSTCTVAGDFRRILKAGQATTTLKVETTETAPLRLVGAGPELGHWQPAKAPKFAAQPGGGQALTLTLPAGLVYSFKLVRDGAGSAQEWEQRDNRYVHLTGPETLTVVFGDA